MLGPDRRSRKFRDRATLFLLGCLLISIVVHFTIGPLLVWLFGIRLTPAAVEQKPVYVVLSTATRIEHRVVPRKAAPPARPQPQQPPQPQPKPQPQQVVKRQAAPRREIARITPRATISAPRVHSVAPQHGLSAEEIAKQEAQFQQTIDRARDANNPVASATQTRATPVSNRPAKIDVPGEMGIPRYGQGILEPVRSWKDGTWDYYYVRYWVQYPDGSTEQGVVPWPIRFPASNDPLGHGFHYLPLPKPLPNYVLPAGTEMNPLVTFCYEHRFQITSCPIQHD